MIVLCHGEGFLRVELDESAVASESFGLSGCLGGEIECELTMEE